MIFNNVNAYSIKGFNLTSEEISSLLAERMFVPCGSYDEKSSGWTSPFGGDSPVLVHSPNKCHLICLKTEEKKIQASIIKEKVEERIIEMIKNNPEMEGVKIKRALKNQIKDEIIKELLPNVIPRSSKIYAYIDEAMQTLIINSSSRSKAETFVMFLQGTLHLNDIQVRPIQTVNSPDEVMTAWLKNSATPENVSLGRKCHLTGTEDGSIIRYARHEMHDKQIIKYTEEGKIVCEMELQWKDNITFVMMDDFMIKSVSFSDEIKSLADEQEIQTPEEDLDVKFSIFTAQMKDFVPGIIDIFGGKLEEESETEKGQ